MPNPLLVVVETSGRNCYRFTAEKSHDLKNAALEPSFGDSDGKTCLGTLGQGLKDMKAGVGRALLLNAEAELPDRRTPGPQQTEHQPTNHWVLGFEFPHLCDAGIPIAAVPGSGLPLRGRAPVGYFLH